MGRRYRGIGLGFLARVAALRASLSRSSIYRSPLKIRIWCGAVDLSANGEASSHRQFRPPFWNTQSEHKTRRTPRKRNLSKDSMPME